MSDQDALNTVQQAYAAFGRGDIPALMATLADDVEWITPGPAQLPTAGTWRGHAAVLRFFEALAAHEDIQQFEPYQFVAQGGTVVVLVRSKSLIKSTGRTITLELAHVFDVANGKVSRFREFFDTAAAMDAYAPATKTATA